MLDMTVLFECGGVKTPVLLLASKLFEPGYLYWYTNYIKPAEARN